VEAILRRNIEVLSSTSDAIVYNAIISFLGNIPELKNVRRRGDTDDQVWDSIFFYEDWYECGFDQVARQRLIDSSKLPYRSELHDFSPRNILAVRVRIGNLSSDGSLAVGHERVSSVTLGDSAAAACCATASSVMPASSVMEDRGSEGALSPTLDISLASAPAAAASAPASASAAACCASASSVREDSASVSALAASETLSSVPSPNSPLTLDDLAAAAAAVCDAVASLGREESGAVSVSAASEAPVPITAESAPVSVSAALEASVPVTAEVDSTPEQPSVSASRNLEDDIDQVAHTSATGQESDELLAVEEIALNEISPCPPRTPVQESSCSSDESSSQSPDGDAAVAPAGSSLPATAVCELNFDLSDNESTGNLIDFETGNDLQIDDIVTSLCQAHGGSDFQQSIVTPLVTPLGVNTENNHGYSDNGWNYQSAGGVSSSGANGASRQLAHVVFPAGGIAYDCASVLPSPTCSGLHHSPSIAGIGSYGNYSDGVSGPRWGGVENAAHLNAGSWSGDFAGGSGYSQSGIYALNQYAHQLGGSEPMVTNETMTVGNIDGQSSMMPGQSVQVPVQVPVQATALCNPRSMQAQGTTGIQSNRVTDSGAGGSSRRVRSQRATASGGTEGSSGEQPEKRRPGRPKGSLTVNRDPSKVQGRPKNSFRNAERIRRYEAQLRYEAQVRQQGLVLEQPLLEPPPGPIAMDSLLDASFELSGQVVGRLVVNGIPTLSRNIPALSRQPGRRPGRQVVSQPPESTASREGGDEDNSYERMRLENIEQNNSVLANLGIIGINPAGSEVRRRVDTRIVLNMDNVFKSLVYSGFVNGWVFMDCADRAGYYREIVDPSRYKLSMSIINGNGYVDNGLFRRLELNITLADLARFSRITEVEADADPVAAMNLLSAEIIDFKRAFRRVLRVDHVWKFIYFSDLQNVNVHVKRGNFKYCYGVDGVEGRAGYFVKYFHPNDFDWIVGSVDDQNFADVLRASYSFRDGCARTPRGYYFHEFNDPTGTGHYPTVNIPLAQSRVMGRPSSSEEDR
jgi:hypothetical protein